MPKKQSIVKLVGQSSAKYAIIINGPTAIGKTSVAVELARWLKTEIISFDSRQFYRELKIGAAPPSPEELEAVKHHFIGHLSISEDFNAGQFETEALKLLSELFQEHDQVILVGGSGLYARALTEGFDEMPEVDPNVRKKLTEEYQSEGIGKLRDELRKKDPDYFDKVDENNPQRIMRALEIIRGTGLSYSKFRKGRKVKRDFGVIKIGLNTDRNLLYKRINERVDLMVQAGLENEVRSLLDYRNKNAMQTVGYREFIRYIDGELSREEAIEEIKKNSRRYAKRQLTWFRREEDIMWFEPGDLAGMMHHIKQQIRR